MKEDIDKARSIFLAAIERYPAAEWAAYLDEACGGDDAPFSPVKEVSYDAPVMCRQMLDDSMMAMHQTGP